MPSNSSCGCDASADSSPAFGDASSTDTSKPTDSAETQAALPSDTTPHCDQPWIDLAADHTTLVPLPLEVTLTAHSGGQDLTAQCFWQVGPSAVCVPGKTPGSVRRVGLGSCTAMCALQNGLCGQVTLQAKAQTVLYILGGEVTAFPPPPTGAADAARIQRLRTADGTWDYTVGWLPEFRIQPVAGLWEGQLWVMGGETGGSYQAIDYWDVFFPTCAEAIITPTAIKQEVGCRSVRRFDLQSGQWDSPMAWQHPRVGASGRQIGERLFAVGGLRAKTVTAPLQPELWAMADLKNLAMHTPAPPVPPELFNTFAKLPWPALPVGELDGQPVILAAGKAWVGSADGSSIAEKDIGWPCPELLPRAVVMRNTAKGRELWVIPSAEAPVSANCAKCPYEKPGANGQLQQWCQPQRRVGQQWVAAPPTPYAPLVEAPDGLYALAADATWRLGVQDAQWKVIAPPLPYGRFGFAAAAGVQ